MFPICYVWSLRWRRRRRRRVEIEDRDRRGGGGSDRRGKRYKR